MLTLVKAETLPSISYSIEPILSSETVLVQELSHQDYAEKFSCQYSEGISADEPIPDSISDGVYAELHMHSFNAQDDLIENAKYRLAHPLDAFLISRLEDGDHALFAKQDIPEGTILFIYSGRLDWSAFDDGIETDETEESLDGAVQIPVDSAQHDDYDEPGFGNYSQNLSDTIEVDAFKVGGFARFMQHLPKKGRIPGPMPFELAESNVHFKQCFVDDSRVLVNVAVANWDINRGEILGFDYGFGFECLARDTLKYYSKQGGVYKKKPE